MNARVIAWLLGRDCWLIRWPLAALAGLALTLTGTSRARSAGVTLALNVLRGVPFHVLLGAVLGERERKALAFVRSLAATPREAAVGKLAAALTLFQSRSAVAATTPASHVAGLPGYYAVVLDAAIVSESVGWTIGVLSGLLFVAGNFALQLPPRWHGVSEYVNALDRGEAGAVAATATLMPWLQQRKTSVV